MSISKKIFIISAVLFASVLFFLGIYNISFKEKTVATKTTDSNAQTNKQEKSTLETIGEKIGLKNTEKIYPLSDEAVISPIITDDGEKIEYYTRLSGSVYKVLLDGDGKELIDDNNFSGLENVSWSPDASRVLSRFNDNGKIQYSSYDYKTKKGSKLIGGIEYAVWSNLNDQIAYKYSDPKTNKKTLNISNYDGNNWKKIADMGNGNSFIAVVPQSSFLSFWNRPSAFEETAFNLVSTVGGEVRKIFSGRFGADYLWSKDGAKALVSSSDSKGGSKINLGIINNNGGEYQNLNIPTFVSKCAWGKDNKTIYYALPSFSSENYVLPNDYQDGKITAKDTFWKMDISSGKAERIVDIKDIKDSYDATGMFLSPSEDILFFINKIDGKLYGINL